MKAYDWRLSFAAAVLAEGGVVAHATEAVFGLAASAFDAEACARVAHLKRRAASQQFIVVAHSLEQISTLVVLDTPLLAQILASWPGPNTWILPATDSAPGWLTGTRQRLAVRLTAHPQAAALCDRAGPLISTSANPSGHPPARRVFEARRYFGARVDYFLPGVVGARQRPSRIRDGLSGAVVRA